MLLQNLQQKEKYYFVYLLACVFFSLSSVPITACQAVGLVSLTPCPLSITCRAAGRNRAGLLLLPNYIPATLQAHTNVSYSAAHKGGEELNVK